MTSYLRPVVVTTAVARLAWEIGPSPIFPASEEYGHADQWVPTSSMGFPLVCYIYYYFASAAVAVDSSRMSASSPASWSRFSPPSNWHVSTMWFMVCRWPQSQEVEFAIVTMISTMHHFWAIGMRQTHRPTGRQTNEEQRHWMALHFDDGEIIIQGMKRCRYIIATVLVPWAGHFQR